DEARANFAAKPPMSSFDRRVVEGYLAGGLVDVEGGGVALACRPEHEAAIYAHGFAHDAFSRLGRVRCPVVLGCGVETTALGPPALADMVRRLPQGRAEAFPALDHFGPFQRPDLVAGALVSAFAGPDRTASVAGDRRAGSPGGVTPPQ
ncbi:MAG: alpha/beta fold hydrolase, partial [Acidimicrobiales bacterium]